jgi:cobalt-zinc-cadmium efflux system outer membrane protein
MTRFPLLHPTRAACAAALLVVSAAGSQAQSSAASPSSRLTLAEAVRLATTVAPAAQAASGRRAELVGRARTDAQWANPIVELRRENIGSPLQYDDFATVTLPVDLLGRRFALRSALGATRDRALADSVMTIRDAEYAAARAWWESWASDALARIALERAELLARIAQVDSLRAAEGEISDAAAFRMQLEAQRATHESGTAAAAGARARATLATLIGTTDAAAAFIDTALPRLAPLPEFDAALAEADRLRPDLRIARATERAAERRRAAEVRGSLSDVGFTGGYKGTAGLSTTVVGLTIAAPLLNANGGNRERSAGEWLLASADRRATELRVANDVRASYVSAALIDDATRGFDDSFIARATVVADAAEASYREGAASLLELLDAFRAAADARAAFVRGTLDRALVRLELRRAMGAPAVEAP